MAEPVFPPLSKCLQDGYREAPHKRAWRVEYGSGDLQTAPAETRGRMMYTLQFWLTEDELDALQAHFEAYAGSVWEFVDRRGATRRVMYAEDALPQARAKGPYLWDTGGIVLQEVL